MLEGRLVCRVWANLSGMDELDIGIFGGVCVCMCAIKLHLKCEEVAD